MKLVTNAPKGTRDLMPQQTDKLQVVEKVLREHASLSGIKEIRTPVFEHTELFLRGVGDTTDVVEKQMYTFNDKGDRSITLRPEGTAGVVRAMLESGIYNDGYPVKLYYFTNCYRYEKPQKGRYREFSQFGVEIFGTAHPMADANLISFVNGFLEKLGLDDCSLEINSIGCKTCRADYNQKLKEYFADKDVCETCSGRLSKNPMRVLDCKSPNCKEFAKDAPKITDCLCTECEEHFAKVKSYLTSAKINYTVNPQIVRGLDYYSRTVFEFVSSHLGAQSTVCGGGRYDGLVEEIGGNPTPALGFGAGIDRIILAMEAKGVEFTPPATCELYIAAMGENALEKAFNLSQSLRDCGVFAECDICGRGLKAQMKYANKIGAKYTIVIGDNEIESGKAELKNMQTGEKKPVSIKDDFTTEFLDKTIENMLGEI